MAARRDVFQAIADPTRREIINIIAQKPQNLNTISANFEISRQAISLHIKILEECGLIQIVPDGNSRFCEIRLEKLTEVYDWVEPYRAMWTKRFSRLKKHLAKETDSSSVNLKKTNSKEDGKDR